MPTTEWRGVMQAESESEQVFLRPAPLEDAAITAAAPPPYLIFSNISAVPPRIAIRSASDKPGVARTSSTIVLVQGYG